MKIYLLGRLNSFQHAFRGLFTLIKVEKNALIHLVLTILALILGLLFHLTYTEWLWVILAIFLVWIMELLNTSVEKMADFIQPNYSPTIRLIKDFAAAAVLLSAIFSVIVALLIFLPKILLQIFP